MVCLVCLPALPNQEIVFNVTWDSVLKKGLTNRKGVQEVLANAMQEITDLLAAGTGKPADPEIYDLAQNDPDGSCQTTTTAASELALVPSATQSSRFLTRAKRI